MSKSTKKAAVAVLPPPVFRGLFFAAHFVVPIGALGLATVLFVADGTLSWETIVLLGIALLPFILPLAAGYVSEAFGVKLHAPPNESGETSKSVPEETAPKVAKESPPGIASATGATPINVPLLRYPPFTTLPAEEQKTLRTLWRHQQRSDPGRLWGFAVREGSSEADEFRRAVNNLGQRGLSYRDDRGLVFLSLAGMILCEVNKDDLAKPGPEWTDFKPA